MRNGAFCEFPLFKRVNIIKDKADAGGERDEELGGQDLKKEFKLPEHFI